MIGEKSTEPRRLRDFSLRLRYGDLGSLPVLLGLAAIWAIFYLANERFVSPVNLTNLMLQIAAVGTISIGVVLLLLLGEIDLSVAAVSGLAAATVAVLNVERGVPAVLAIVSGLLVGCVVGTLNGFFVTRFNVPSFVVTLAGYLGWQGALLYVLGDTGTINVRDPLIVGIANTFLLRPVGWALGAVVVAGYLAALVVQRRNRLSAGLEASTGSAILARTVLVAAVVLFGVAVLNADRGVPSAVVVFVGLVFFFHLLTTRTRFGRHMFAIGGNAEAARRAGIRVQRTRFVVFVIASTMAAAGGILAASRLLAVNQSSGSGDLLLNAIAAAVIGGTSLFGGRGSAWSALLGALVIGSISNGMDLLAYESSIKFMVTGAVLLGAVVIDSTTRDRRRAPHRS